MKKIYLTKEHKMRDIMGREILPGIRVQKAANGYFLNIGNFHGRGARFSWMPQSMTVGPGWLHAEIWDRQRGWNPHIALRYSW